MLGPEEVTLTGDSNRDLKELNGVSPSDINKESIAGSGDSRSEALRWQCVRGCEE